MVVAGNPLPFARLVPSARSLFDIWEGGWWQVLHTRAGRGDGGKYYTLGLGGGMVASTTH